MHEATLLDEPLLDDPQPQRRVRRDVRRHGRRLVGPDLEHRGTAVREVRADQVEAAARELETVGTAVDGGRRVLAWRATSRSAPRAGPR